MKKTQKGGGYGLKYNTHGGCGSIIFRCYGSVWPSVLPYCIANVILLGALQYLKHVGIVDISFSDKGHSFMGMLMAFLVVSRVTMSVSRSNESKNYMAAMYRETRELAQHFVEMTRNQIDDEAREWRNEAAYRSCLLLRTAMAVVDYPSQGVPAWEVPELSDEERDEIKGRLFLDLGSGSNAKRWAHGARCEEEESMRVPQRCAYKLRCSLGSQGSRLAQPLHPLQASKLQAGVDQFMTGYYGMKKWINTPTSFPLIQMTRTFLVLYLYSLPFVLLDDITQTIPSLFIIFILTFGFVGLEEVATQLDDPYGDDETDFNNLGMAYTTFEDIYLLILDVDGSEWTDKLRAKMYSNNEEDELNLPNEGSWLLETDKQLV